MARPRKKGDRYPSGKLKPDNAMPGAKVRRIVEMAEKGATDPVLGTPVGWLLMTGELAETKTMANVLVEAAKLYDMQRREWDMANESPARNAKALDVGKVAVTSSQVASGRKNRAGRYERTRDGVLALLTIPVGRRAIAVLDDAIVCLNRPAYDDITILKAGLYAVAQANGMLPVTEKLRPEHGGAVYKIPVGPKVPA